MSKTTKRATDATVPGAVLKAAVRFAAKQEGLSRYALNGVNVEPGRVVATTGKILTMITFQGSATDHRGDEPVIVAVDSLRSVLRLKPTAVRVNGRLEMLKGNRENDDLAPDGTLPLESIEGSFPDWEGVVPKRDEQAGLPKGAAVSFNPEFLKTVTMAAKDLGIGRLSFAPNGPNGAGLYHGEHEGVDFTAVLMPIA